MKATNRGWISALFAALAVCWTFVLHGDEQASKNLFPNPSFENWVDDKTPESGGWKWTVALTDEFGSPRYKHIGASTDDAHSGRYSLHMHDVKAGGHDEVLKCTLPKDVVAQFRGKGLKFSVWTKLAGKGAKAGVGIGAICASRESATVSASEDFPKDVNATDGFKQLRCYLKIPGDAYSITLTFRCANGYWATGEAYFDDCELTTVPVEEVPETDAERERRLRKPFVPNQEAIAWAAPWMKPMVFADDGRKRPAICGGNLVNADGSYFYPVGVWLHPSADRDWNEKAIAKHGIEHPAYTTPPGKAVFDVVGCNAAQISGAPCDIAAADKGYFRNKWVKNVDEVAQRIDGIRDYWRGFGDMWMAVDFAFGYRDQIKSLNPDLYERIDQRCSGWHGFLPFCPECADGRDYYRNFYETGAKLALASGLNVGVWELVNESVYGCECEYNKRNFASRMENRYGSIESANAAWGTSFGDFGELSRAADLSRFKGLWNEWCAFLATRYAEVLTDMKDYIRTIDRRPNVYFTEQLFIDSIWNGMMDYRKIGGVLDALTLEGGWHYGGGADGFKAKDEMEAVVFAGSQHWYVLDFFQALARGRKPVFNHEHYCTRLVDGKRVPSRAMDYVTSMWLEFFHGLAGSQMYIWEKRAPEWTTFDEAKANVIHPSYKSSAMLNPYNWPTSELDAFWRFRRELDKYQDRISEFPRTPAPSVAIYHSQTTAAMATKFGRPIKSPMLCAHAAVLHALYPVTFVFDDDLTGGRIPESVKAIVIPAADFETDAVREGLLRFIEHGGTVIADRRAFSFDERGRKAKGPPRGAILYDAGPTNAASVLEALANANVRKTAELIPIDGKGEILGADVQIIDRGDFKLVLVVNMIAGGSERRVRLSIPIAEDAGWTVCDAVTNSRFTTPNGKESFTSDDIRKGIELTIPYQERVLIAINKIKSDSLVDGFRNPPNSAKPHTWYHMMNGNVTKEGITCDFEALAEAGIGGVQMFDVGCSIPTGNLAFNSPDWFDMLRHAASEARRLGLEICIPNCSGWSSSGGPWNMPSNGMKKVVFSETAVKGPSKFAAKLPREEKDNGFYEDIAVLAFPSFEDAEARLSGIAAKTFGVRGDIVVDKADGSQKHTVQKDRIVDLTRKMEPDGSLKWNVPEGQWTILRVGYICNGRRNHPGSRYGVGLEVDKLSASAMDYHFSQYASRLCEYLGPLAGNVESGLNNILVDSFEVGTQNWTQGFENIFESRMGYSILPYLPVFSGRVVGSVDESERFLEDFRRVVADFFAENYAGRLAELCHSRGLMLSLEPYGNCPCDNLQYGQDVDIPMGEFWSCAQRGDHFADLGNARFPAYLAHVWGRRYAAAESFTASPARGGRWITTPFSIKAQGDAVYCNGVNRIIYHRFVHQPWPGNKYLPGMTMGRWGMHFDRTQTWWKFAAPWFRYQARCQWMLQEGKPTADALFYCGEEAPNQGGNTFGGKFKPEMNLADGYNWDVCATKALKELKVVDGNVVVPGGVSYRLLVLPARESMSEELLKAIDSLVDAGAKVCGTVKPVRAPGLRGYPDVDGRVQSLAEKVWAKGVMECGPIEALKRLGVKPDFASSQKKPAPSWIHRRGDDADWYFVALNNVKEHAFEASFRMTGRQPEIWDAETGEIRDADEWREEGGRTCVKLSFLPSGSAFVVFRKGIGDRKQGTGKREQEPQSIADVSGPWQVSFPIDWYTGGTSTKTVDMPELVDWTSVTDPDIKYFSGTATYKCKVENVECKIEEGQHIFLDLGEVKNFAEVTVNGKTYEPLWRPPFRVDITDAIQESSKIELSIRVANLWPNRLIGDDVLYADDCEWKGEVKNGVKEIGIKEIPQWVKDGKPSPTGRHTFNTWKHWDKNDKLLPAGLLGHVRLCLSKSTSE